MFAGIYQMLVAVAVGCLIWLVAASTYAPPSDGGVL